MTLSNEKKKKVKLVVFLKTINSVTGTARNEQNCAGHELHILPKHVFPQQHL